MHTGYAAGPAIPRRRLLAGWGAAMAVGGLTGCGVRLEEDAPSLPLVPRRVPVPGELVLLDLLRGTRALAESAAAASTTDAAAGPGVVAALADLHRQQVPVLHDALLRGGVPSSVLDRHETSAPERAAPEAADGTRADLAAAEESSVGDTQRFREIGSDLAAPVLALLAQRLAAARLLSADPGAPPVSAPTPLPVGADPTATASADVLTVAMVAAHHFEVVQARSLLPDDRAHAETLVQREHAALTATWLAAMIRRWRTALGDQAPPVPLSVVLPFTVDGPQAAARLAAHTLEGLRTAYGRVLDTLTGPGLDAAWLTVPPELADLEVHAHDWGVPLAAFPGLA